MEARATIVSGSMICPDSDSDSSKEFDNEPINTKLTASEDSDEESLEVFGNNISHATVTKNAHKYTNKNTSHVKLESDRSIQPKMPAVSQNVSNATLSDPPIQKSLIDLMGIAVARATAQSDSLIDKVPSSSSSITGSDSIGSRAGLHPAPEEEGFGFTAADIATMTSATAKNAEDTQAMAAAVQDTFGITYRPYKTHRTNNVNTLLANTSNNNSALAVALDADEIALQQELFAFSRADGTAGATPSSSIKAGDNPVQKEDMDFDFDFEIQPTQAKSNMLPPAPVSAVTSKENTNSEAPSLTLMPPIPPTINTDSSSTKEGKGALDSPSRILAQRQKERELALMNRKDMNEMTANDTALLLELKTEAAQEVEMLSILEETTNTQQTQLPTSLLLTQHNTRQAAIEAMRAVTSIYEPGAAGDMLIRLELEQNQSITNENTVTHPMKSNPTCAPLPTETVSNRKITAIMEQEEGEEEEEQQAVTCTKNPSVNISIISEKGFDNENRLEKEWEQIEMPDSAIDPTLSTISTIIQTATVDTQTFLTAARLLPLEQHQEQIVTFKPRERGLLTKIGLGWMSSHPKIGTVEKLTQVVENQLKFPFLLAQEKWNPSIDWQLNALRTIYYRLLPERNHQNSVTVLSATGPHWEHIGFQGLDPCTDVNRAMRLLAVYQMLQFTEKEHFELCQSLYQLSRLDSLHKENPSIDGTGRNGQGKQDLSWPFFCVSISFTKEALIALRTGELNSYCNRFNSVLETLHAFYRACFFDFRSHLLAERTVHHAEHLAALRKRCAESPKDVLKRYLHAIGASAMHEKHSTRLNTTAAKQQVSTSSHTTSQDFVSFTNYSIDQSLQDTNQNASQQPMTGKASRFLA